MSSTEIAVDRTSVERLGTGQKRTAAEAFAAPEEAGALLYAQFWYYIDAAGVTQGPFDSLKMRSWLEAGYMNGATTVSPSYYGEVPTQFWRLSELYQDPLAEGFLVASDALVATEAEVPPEEFIPAEKFAGARAGYVFKNDHYGVGYYLDEEPPKTVTYETLEEEKRIKRYKASKLSAHAMPKFDAISS